MSVEAWGRTPGTIAAGLGALVVAAVPELAHAHAGERGIVLLLPTGFYQTGGTVAVAVSFLVLALMPQGLLRQDHRKDAWSVQLYVAHDRLRDAASLASFVFLCFLLYAGFTGSRDPLSNPLPITIWSLWWVGLTLVQALIGDIWSWINPWRGPMALLRALAPARLSDRRPLLRYPNALGYWPAIAGFLGFAWFEIISLAPADPAILARTVGTYWLVTLLGCAVFGTRTWLARGECFSIFLGFISRLSPFSRGLSGEVRAHLPAATLLHASPLPISGVLFILLTLATVSFDGMTHTFWWLGLGGINPLEYPGRSAVMARNSAGLVAVWATLCAGYLTAVWLGCRLAGRPERTRQSVGLLIFSIMPISLGYHFAHYLSVLLVNLQYAARIASDPLARGNDFFGTAQLQVTTSFLTNYDSVYVIWLLQAGAIVVAHVAGVLLAHLLALRLFGGEPDAAATGRAAAGDKAATISQIPLAIVMVAYTLFGLWLLSTPVAN